jgi:hypothetical protein
MSHTLSDIPGLPFDTTPIMLTYKCEPFANKERVPTMAQESLIARRCERAVVTAYSELRQVGSDDMSAFQACTALYRIHHPEASINEARRLVAEWIDHHLVRKAPGPTDGCPCD